MKSRSEPHSPARALILTGLVLLAPLLAGASALWAQALVFLAFGTLLLIAPPRRSLGPWWNFFFVTFGLLAGSAFLPARWFPPSSWRETLFQEYGVHLASTCTPQPWLTLEAACLLLGGLIIAYAMLAEPWSHGSRASALRAYALGMLALTVLALASLFLHRKLPFWPTVGNSGVNFGFFPNRNHTADVLALAGIITTAVAFEDLSKGRKQAWAWFIGLAAIGMALVVAFSRAGILIFFLGTVVWVLASFAVSKSKIGAAVCLAGVCLLLAFFLLFGGQTLERFHFATAKGLDDFRLVVQREALELSWKAPGLGQGLGNFEPVFAMARASSLGQKRLLHPESDWVWTVVEMGWPALLLLGSAAALWLWQCFPFQSGTDRALRLAATIAGTAFLLHGFADVSGHRLGAALPALLLCALARHPAARAPVAAWVGPAFRFLGGVLVAIAIWWLAGQRWEAHLPPTSGTLARLFDRMDAQRQAGDYPALAATADEALGIAPLDWNLYYQRAVGRAASDWPLWLPQRDFATARYLEPHWVELAVGEGEFWLALDRQQLAFDAWREALRRAGDEAPALLRRMARTAVRHYELREALWQMSRNKADYFLVLLESATPLECENEIARWRETDPALRSFSRAQRKELFQAWGARGDRDQLITLLLAHPEWEEDGWPWLARRFAAQGDFERAYVLSRKFSPRPALPPLVSSSSVAELERAFHFHPDSLQQGLSLFAAYRSVRQVDDALATLRILKTLPDAPAYLNYFEAELRAERNEWQKAWAAWEQYREVSGLH